jgi:endonuclease/exonuclease/phosphatase family metal-dependent hydrolase
MRTFIFILSLLYAGASASQSLHVMTYNIRLDYKGDGINQWPNRVEKVTSLIRRYDPDIIGIQEALHHQLVDLLKALPEYSFCGVGRDDGKEKGEFSAILVRNGRFGVLDQKTSWLSETPEVAGSKSWDAAITRIVTRARLFDKESKREFLIINTHFDHVGKEARKQSAAIIRRMALEAHEANQIPVIVTGDFNFERADEPYAVIINDTTALFDSKPPGDVAGTFCGFEVGSMECKTIDYIFHTKEWIPRGYRVINDHDGKHYPSDHLPVLVAFDLASEN